MWLYRFLFCVPFVWAKTTENHGIPKGFDSQDIKDVFYSHSHGTLKSRTYDSSKSTKGRTTNEEQLFAGRFSPTGWITKCRGLECISTVTRNNADNFLNKALDVLDKYTPLKSATHSPTKKQDRESSNSLATLLATTSGVIETSTKAKQTKTETKKSHGKIDNNESNGIKRQGWYKGSQAPGLSVNNMGTHTHGLYEHHIGPSALNSMGVHYHGSFGPHVESTAINNIDGHAHGFYQPHVGMHKTIHVMDPAYGGMDHTNTLNAGTIAHFHQPVPFPIIGSPVVHRHDHFHPPLPFVDMSPLMVHHHATSHVKLNEPMVHVNQNPNMLFDGPVPPYPSIPFQGSLSGIHDLPIKHVPVPVPVPVPGPPRIQHIPIPVPGPTRIQNVPYPVPVAGPPEIHPVMVPIHYPPAIQKVPVPFPVRSPPLIRNVPYPVPYPVASPPKIKEVPYPVGIPVRQQPVIQRFFYPVGIPQPGQVHHVPFPIYIRQPSEIKPVPYPVRIQSPPEKVPIPIPSEPEVVIQRVPYPVMVPQPSPIHEEHHYHHQQQIVTHNGQCNINPCTNGGTCTAFEDSYKCHCQEGFNGVHCEDQSKCHPNPCRNLGTCTEVEKGYECTCQPGFKGINCDTPDPCSPSPCKNGGTCAEVGNSFTCDCRIGWIGKDCGMEAKCLPINPCQNGGTCTEALGSYHCNCMDSWQGLSCEISVPDMTTDTLGQSRGGCDVCAPNAYCEQNRCVCTNGYLGDGYTCDLFTQIHGKRAFIKKLMQKKNLNIYSKLSKKRHHVPKSRSKYRTNATKNKALTSHS